MAVDFANNKEKSWQKFISTGSVLDYLNYSYNNKEIFFKNLGETFKDANKRDSYKKD